MRSLGITRGLDKLGRITLPIEIRKSLGMEHGTPLEILADDKGIYIQKHSTGCRYCGGMDNVVVWHGEKVCKVCAADILAKSVKESVEG